MLNNVKDFGAAGDGVTDDRPESRRRLTTRCSTNKGGNLLSGGHLSRLTCQSDETVVA